MIIKQKVTLLIQAMVDSFTFQFLQLQAKKVNQQGLLP